MLANSFKPWGLTSILKPKVCTIKAIKASKSYMPTVASPSRNPRGRVVSFREREIKIEKGAFPLMR